MKEIKLGIIGYNEGNGHPYSFSAIINGFNPNADWSRYPQILEYLKLNQLPKLASTSDVTNSLNITLTISEILVI